jgi:hypothetical protein
VHCSKDIKMPLNFSQMAKVSASIPLISINETDGFIKSTVVVLCLANYILIPFDTKVMKSVIALNWINLVAYVLIEQLFLATFRRLDFRVAGYISMGAALAQLQISKNQTALLKADEMGLLFPVCVGNYLIPILNVKVAKEQWMWVRDLLKM